MPAHLVFRRLHAEDAEEQSRRRSETESSTLESIAWRDTDVSLGRLVASTQRLAFEENFHFEDPLGIVHLTREFGLDQERLELELGSGR